MNEKRTISGTIAGAAFVCLLAVLIGCMVAPVFGGWIKHLLYVEYGDERDGEQKVNEMMPIVWVGLWIIALLAWAFVFLCNC